MSCTDCQIVFRLATSRAPRLVGAIGHKFGKVPRDAGLYNSLLTSIPSYTFEIQDSYGPLRVNMLVDFSLVTRMDMLMRTVRTGMFVSITGGVS
jgi:hypothetical protein